MTSCLCLSCVRCCGALRSCTSCLGILVLIFWILEALFEGVLTLWPVDVTGLEVLVVALKETLVIPVVALVGTLANPVTAMIFVVATNVFLVVCSTMRMAMLVTAIVASVMLIHKIANLVVVALHHLMAEFAFCAKLDLLLTLLCEQAIGHLGVVDVVELLGNGLKCFVAEASSALEVPGAVLLMKRHIKPLNLECIVGRMHVSCRKGFG